MARFKPGVFDVVGVVAVAAMIWAMVGLFTRHGSGLGELTLDLSQEELADGFREGYEFHGVYMGAKKVGTLRTESRKLAEGYQMLTELELTVTMLGQNSQTLTRLDAVLDDEFRLNSFDLEMQGGQITGTMNGSWTGSAMVVDADLNIGEFSRSFEMPEAPFILTSLRSVVMRRSLEEGERLSLTYFDPVNMQPITSDIVYLGRTDIEVMGKRVEAFHFEEVKLGTVNNVFVNELGEVMVEEMGLMGLRAVREPEAEARYGIRAGGGSGSVSDLAPLTDAERALTRPEATQLQFVLAYSDALTHRFEGARRLVGDRIGVPVSRSVALPETGLTSDRLKKHYAAELLPTLGSNPDDPALGTILGRYREHQERSDHLLEALTKHVHEALRYDPNAQHPSGNAALDAGSGDALAHARALVALLRASNIPARIVHGAVYVPGEPARMARHVWVEAMLKDTWHGVDPVLGTAPADAARLAFVKGELERADLLNERIGALQLIDLEDVTP